MTIKKILANLIIVLLIAFPASAGDVSLNKWVLNITLNDDGQVEEVIQAELENTGTSSLDGFSFIVPAPDVIINSGNIISIPASESTVKQETTSGGIKVNINFGRPVESGNKWNGRFSFTVQKWAQKEGSDYSIIIPVTAPKAIVSNKEIDFSIPVDPEIRGQVFLPKAVDVTSVDVKSKEKSSFKKLLQFDHIVLTWFKLNIGDEISVKGKYSDILRQIVETDEKTRETKDMIQKAKDTGMDVAEAETHLKKAEDYNNNQALQSFWINDFNVVQEYVGYANQELKLAQNSLSSKSETKVTPGENTQSKATPGFMAQSLIFIIIISVAIFRKKLF